MENNNNQKNHRNSSQSMILLGMMRKFRKGVQEEEGE